MPESLQQLLLERAERRSPWLIFPRDPEKTTEATWLNCDTVRASAGACASGLAGAARPRSRIILISDNDQSFVVGFFGILAAGMIPVPFAPPHFAESQIAYGSRLAAVEKDCSPALILTGSRIAEAVARSGNRATPIAPVEEMVTRCSSPIPWHSGTAHETALIQYTSGSTGAPRGAELSHRSLIHNVLSIGAALAACPGDVGVSWLPLFHDMGLIGCLLFTLACDMHLVLLRPRTFLFRPATWLWAISRFGAKMSPASNFAYALCASRVPDSSLAGLDLRSWGAALNGAEAVQRQTLDAFAARFGPVGFRREALVPVYGLAENALAVTFATPGGGVRLDHVERDELERNGTAVPAMPGGPSTRTVVSVGRPIGSQELRIAGSTGATVPDRCVGEVQVRGPCVMKGYYGKREETERTLALDGWLRTGDRGYLADGELFIVGRQKDIIKKHGSCLDAADVQSVVDGVEGVRRGYVAVFGVTRPTSGTEDLVVCSETVVREPEQRAALRHRIACAVLERCGVRPDTTVLVGHGAVPRSTSGKVQHQECKTRFLSGSLETHDGIPKSSD